MLHLQPKRRPLEAMLHCQRNGMALLRLYSRAHNTNVHRAVLALTSQPYLVGLTDILQEGVYVWMADNTTMTEDEAVWNGGEPNNWNRDEHCTTANWSKTEGWNDSNCWEQHVFICSPANITDVCARFPCDAPLRCTPNNGTSLTPAGRTCS